MKKISFKLSSLKFDKNGLIPAVIQDYKNNELLMVAYMNKESLRRTLKLGKTCFWSRSRKEYWVKGLTSGHFQFVKSVAYDCDGDALLTEVSFKLLISSSFSFNCASNAETLLRKPWVSNSLFLFIVAHPLKTKIPATAKPTPISFFAILPPPLVSIK